MNRRRSIFLVLLLLVLLSLACSKSSDGWVDPPKTCQERAIEAGFHNPIIRTDWIGTCQVFLGLIPDKDTGLITHEVWINVK